MNVVLAGLTVSFVDTDAHISHRFLGSLDRLPDNRVVPDVDLVHEQKVGASRLQLVFHEADGAILAAVRLVAVALARVPVGEPQPHQRRQARSRLPLEHLLHLERHVAPVAAHRPHFALEYCGCLERERRGVAGRAVALPLRRELAVSAQLAVVARVAPAPLRRRRRRRAQPETPMVALDAGAFDAQLQR